LHKPWNAASASAFSARAPVLEPKQSTIHFIVFFRPPALPLLDERAFYFLATDGNGKFGDGQRRGNACVTGYCFGKLTGPVLLSWGGEFVFLVWEDNALFKHLNAELGCYTD
jgi:hypothetical protein